MNLAYGHEVGKRRDRDIRLDLETRLRSLYILGSSGSGKTSAMKGQIYCDLAEGNGLAVLDVEEVLAPATLSYAEHLGKKPEDVIVIDPTERAVPLNVLAPVPGVDPYTTVENVLGAFRRAWFDSWGDRMADLLRHALLLLLEKRLTIAHLPRLISDEQYQLRLARTSEQESVRLFFCEHLRGISKREYRTWIESSRNKVSQFAQNPFLEPMFGAADCLDFKEVMDAQKTVVVNLPERVLRDSGRLAAMLILSKVYEAALRRPETSPPFFVYADEFSSFASRAFLDLITRTRKRRIGLICAHQNLSQPPFDKDQSFLDTLLANTAVHMIFQCGRKDAERFASEIFQPTGTEVKRRKRHWLWGEYGDPAYYSLQEEKEFYIAELENQRPRECYIKVKSAGGARVYAAETYDLPQVEEDGETLKAASLALHASQKPRIEAEQAPEPEDDQDDGEYQGEPA